MARQYTFKSRKQSTGRKHRASNSNAKQSLAKFLAGKSEAVKQAAADALNEASAEVVKAIQANMASAGIVNRTGNLKESVEAEPATAKRPRVLIKSEAVVQAPPINKQGSINPGMKGRYADGKATYGRYIEFSPRINKPWFYPAWYAKQREVREKIIDAIGKAWSNE